MINAPVLTLSNSILYLFLISPKLKSFGFWQGFFGVNLLPQRFK